MSLVRGRHRAIAGAIGVFLALAMAGVTQAHVVKDFGPFSVALGWSVEPTYVGQINAVQVVVKDKAGKPVTDLADGDLQVVVSFGGQRSAALTLVNKFDADTGLGIPGDYEASLTPTTSGDYTFHLTGTIHGQAVDETATSSDATFSSAVEATDIQFPDKLPSLTQITTRLDRIDARLASPPAPAPTNAPVASADTTTGAALAAVGSTAAQARDAASTAMLTGILIGGIGVILGGVALAVAIRRPRRP